jgi:hypothetical protein
MAASKSASLLAFVLSALALCVAQRIPQRSSQVPDKVLIDEVSGVPVPSLPAESIAMPVLCDPDGRVLFRLAMPDTGVKDPVSVSSDGKTVIRFGKEKINDVSHPKPLSMFLGGSDVYILTLGSVPLGYETKWRKPNGEVETQQTSKSSAFVAHFESNGTYAGAVPLDIPFKPLHLGVFANGDFFISGADPWTDEPRAGIVGSNGQFRRSIELKGDVRARDESAGSAKDQDPTALPRSKTGQGSGESLRDVVYTSQIARDGPNILLFRPLNGPVFSISPSGEARVHKLKIEGNYRLFTIKPTRDSWVVEFIRDLPEGKGQEFATYAFDPDTGAPMRQYFFPPDLGWGLACTDGAEFTFVVADFENKSLKLLKLAPPVRSN